MAQYNLFVLKVRLNPEQTNKQMNKHEYNLWHMQFSDFQLQYTQFSNTRLITETQWCWILGKERMSSAMLVQVTCRCSRSRQRCRQQTVNASRAVCSIAVRTVTAISKFCFYPDTCVYIISMHCRYLQMERVTFRLRVLLPLSSTT